MKKTYNLEKSNTPIQRQVDSIKGEVKKYIARERRKKLPEGFDFWKFDCKFGDTEGVATAVFANELKTLIDKSINDEKKYFYIEIISRAVKNESKK